MTLSDNDYDSARQAIAFARAWLDRDSVGANHMFLTLPTDQLPGFVSSLALMIQNALSLGSVDVDSFFEALLEVLDDVESAPEP